MNKTPALKVPLQTEPRFRLRGNEQPPKIGGPAEQLRADGWPAAARSGNSNNDLRPGRRSSFSNGFGAGRALVHRGREPAIQAGRRRPRGADGVGNLVGREAFSGCHHLNTAPVGVGRLKAHRQVLALAGAAQNMSVALAAHDVLGNPLTRLSARGRPGRGRPARGATIVRTEDRMLHPGRSATVRLPRRG
jgi:hypothetical protein